MPVPSTKELMPVMLKMSAKYSNCGQEKFYFSNNSYDSNKKQNKKTAIHLYEDCQYGKNIKPNNLRVITSFRENLEEQGFYLCEECANLHVQKVINLVETLPLYKENDITAHIILEFYNTPHLPGSVMTNK